LPTHVAGSIDADGIVALREHLVALALEGLSELLHVGVLEGVVDPRLDGRPARFRRIYRPTTRPPGTEEKAAREVTQLTH